MREKNMPKNNKKQTNVTLPRLFKVVTFWFLKLRSLQPRFQVTYRSKPYPQLTSSICHRKSVGATPKCRAKDASCVFLSPNQELPSGQRALGYEISFSEMICSKILISQNFGMGLGYKYKPFWTLRIPYRTWDVVICLTWGKTTSKLHQDTVTSASACREVSGRLMMSGWRLSYQKKHMILRIQTGSYCRVEGSNPIRKVVGFDRTLIPFWKDISGFLGCESYFVPGFLLIKWSWNISIHLDTELPSHIKKWQGGYLKKHLWLVCLLRPIFMNGPMTYFHRKPPSPKEFAMPFWTNPNPTQPTSTQPTSTQPIKTPNFFVKFLFPKLFRLRCRIWKVLWGSNEDTVLFTQSELHGFSRHICAAKGCNGLVFYRWHGGNGNRCDTQQTHRGETLLYVNYRAFVRAIGMICNCVKRENV